MSYAYSYENDDGTPLVKCPYCGADLTRQFKIRLTVACAGIAIDALTRLDDQGRLIDIDGAVKDGNHSGTACASCREDLIDYENMEET